MFLMFIGAHCSITKNSQQRDHHHHHHRQHRHAAAAAAGPEKLRFLKNFFQFYSVFRLFRFLKVFCPIKTVHIITTLLQVNDIMT